MITLTVLPSLIIAISSTEALAAAMASAFPAAGATGVLIEIFDILLNLTGDLGCENPSAQDAKINAKIIFNILLQSIIMRILIKLNY